MIQLFNNKRMGYRLIAFSNPFFCVAFIHICYLFAGDLSDDYKNYVSENVSAFSKKYHNAIAMSMNDCNKPSKWT